MWSVYTQITQNLGLMVVEADETSTDRINNIKLFPKSTFLATDVPPPSQIIQEIRNIGDSVPSKIEKSLKSQISNLDELSKGRANTLNNSIKNVSSDVSTMSRTVTQEVSAVSKGISGLSGMVTGVSGAVTSIANGAVTALLLENVVKPMFTTLNNTVDLTRITVQKFFEKQIAIFQPGSTSNYVSSNDSLFVQMLKNLINPITSSINEFSRRFDVGWYVDNNIVRESAFVSFFRQNFRMIIEGINKIPSIFDVGWYVDSNIVRDSAFISFFRQQFKAIIEGINIVPSIFNVGWWNNTSIVGDSAFISFFRQQFKTMIDGINKIPSIFNVGWWNNTSIVGDSAFVNFFRQQFKTMIDGINKIPSIFNVGWWNNTSIIGDSAFINFFRQQFKTMINGINKIPSVSNIETRLADIIKTITKVPALNDLIKNSFNDLSKTFASIIEPIKNIGINIVKTLFESISKFFIPSDPNFLKNKIKGIQTKFNTKFQVPLGFLNIFKTLFNFKRTPFPKQVTLTFYGKETVIPLMILTMLFDVVRPITTSLLCLTILAECYKRISGSDEATLQ